MITILRSDPDRVENSAAPVVVARTAAGRKAVRRRARRAALRRPAGAALSGYPGTAATVSADHGPVDGGPAGVRLGRWARLGTTVTVTVVLVVVAASLFGGGSHVVTVPVTVRPGDTLLTIARAAQPDADASAVEEAIREANGLSGDAVRSGQVLLVPSAA